MFNFDPKNWYYQLRSDGTKVFSSARGVFVAMEDAEFTAWVNAGNSPSPVDTAAEIGQALSQYLVRPTDTDVLDGYTSAQAAEIASLPSFKVIFALMKQVATLRGLPTPSVNEAILTTKGLL